MSRADMAETLLAIYQVMIDGLALGAVWFLVAVGMSMTRWLSGIFDLSHALWAVLAGALAVWLMQTTGLSRVSAALLTLIAIAALAAPIQIIALRPLEWRSMLEGLAATGALAFVGLGAIRVLFGPGPYLIGRGQTGSTELLGLPFALYALILAALVVLIALVLGLRRTRFGIMLRAVAESPRTAAMLGVQFRMMRLAGYVAGAVLAAMGGIMGNAVLQSDSTTLMHLLPGLAILIAAVPPGRIAWLFAAAMILGLFQQISSTALPNFGTVPMLVFGLAALALSAEITRRRA